MPVTIGAEWLDNYADGTTRTAASTMSPDGNFFIGGGTAFQDAWKFRVTGDAYVHGYFELVQIKTNTTQNFTTDGSEDATLHVDDGCCLLYSGTGNGYTGSNGVLQVNCRSSGKLQDGASFRASNNSNNVIIFLNEDNTLRGRVDGTGSSSMRYRTSSDRRLKENVTNMDSCWELLKQLNPKNCNWIEDGRKDVGSVYSFK